MNGPPDASTGTAAAEGPARAVPRRVWRGTALLVLGRVWGSACTLLMLFVLRPAGGHLSADAFGRFTFYLAVFMLLDSLADFGTGQIAVQRTAADDALIPEVLAATRRIRFAMGSLGVLLVGGGALAWREPGAGWILLASLYPVTHVFELSITVFRNRIAWGVPVAVRAIASGLSLAFVLGLIGLGDREPAHLLCGVAAGSAIGNVMLLIATRAHLPRRPAAWIPLAEIFVAALPLGLAGLFQMAYFYVDNLFVRALCGPAPLGPYNIGVRVMSYSIMVAIYATQAALPWLAREHAHGNLGTAVAKLSQPLFACAGFGCGLLWPWTEKILALFGQGFEIAGPSTRWLLAATAVVYAGSGLMTALVAAGKMKSILAIAATALAVNVLANSFLVPSMGIEGAGLATLITEATVAIGAAVALVRVGVRPVHYAGALGWLAGPALFALGAWLSSSLPLG
jgi:O-antigen/teichoic acid export membrane protein